MKDYVLIYLSKRIVSRCDGKIIIIDTGVYPQVAYVALVDVLL